MSKINSYEESNSEFKRVLQDLMFNYTAFVRVKQNDHEKQYRLHIQMTGNNEEFVDCRCFANSNNVEEDGFNLTIKNHRNMNIVALKITEKLDRCLKNFLIHINKLPTGEYVIQKENNKLLAIQKFPLE